MRDHLEDTPPAEVLSIAGEIGRLIEGKDWSKTPLGNKDHWSPLFKSLLSTILGNRFPMLLYWGPEMYCFYNDAFRASLGSDGKHPAILGMPGKDAWAEAWDIMGPRLNRALSDGESSWSEDELVPFLRNGRMEDSYWTYSYSPVIDGSQDRIGVLVTCVETTENVRILARSRSDASFVRSIMQQVPVAIAMLKGPEHVVEIVNDRALEIWGRTRSEIMDRPILEVMPELVGQGFDTMLGDALAGTPFSATALPVTIRRNNQLVTVYLNFTYEPLIGADGVIEGVMAVGADVTETVLAKQRAEAGEMRFRLLADSMPQFIWTGTPEGQLNYFNKAVSDYSGVPSEKLTAEGWLMIVHADERDANIRAWTEAITTGNDFSFEHRFRRKDGEYRWQLSRARPLRDKNGKINLWIGTSTDIQEIKEQDQEKNYLIGMAGHEMRTPLSTLRSCVDLLNHEMSASMDAEQRHLVKMMERQVDKLARMLSDMVDVSTLKKGSLELDLSRFDVAEMVRNVVDEMRRNHPRRVFEVHADVAASVRADKFRINQVLGNLLGNAVKYSPDGSDITISCTIDARDVTIAICDRGFGIPKAEQELIFRRFYRVQKSEYNRHIEGFGIGLYLVADIIKRHNGQLYVDSEEGKGSLFSFSIPLAV